MGTLRPQSTYDFPLPEVYSCHRDGFAAGRHFSHRDAYFDPRVYTGGYTPKACVELLFYGMDQMAFGYVIGERWEYR